jgi:hypothetical protein
MRAGPGSEPEEAEEGGSGVSLEEATPEEVLLLEADELIRR